MLKLCTNKLVNRISVLLWLLAKLPYNRNQLTSVCYVRAAAYVHLSFLHSPLWVESFRIYKIWICVGNVMIKLSFCSFLPFNKYFKIIFRFEISLKQLIFVLIWVANIYFRFLIGLLNTFKNLLTYSKLY